MKPTPWTAADERDLRKLWGWLPLSLLAEEFGRTRCAIKQRAKIIGLVRCRFFTEGEKATIRRLYATHTAEEIASSIGRSPSSVYQVARKLGLPLKTNRLPPGTRERIRVLYEEDLSDQEIADRLKAEGISIKRSWVSAIRRDDLHLPVNAKAIRRARLRAVATQAKRLGIRPGGQLRVLAFRAYARSFGFPEEMRPREVQILRLLAARQPLTRKQVCEAIGMRYFAHSGMHSNGPSGTYLGELMRRGLVFYQNRSVKTGRQGRGRIPGLYWLTAAGLALVEQSLQPKGEGHGSTQRSEPGRPRPALSGRRGDRGARHPA